MAGRRRGFIVSNLVQPRFGFLVFLSCLVLIGPAAAGEARQASPGPTAPAQVQRPPQEGVPPVDPDKIPISVQRIREGLQQEPVINRDLLRPTFRVTIVEKRPEWVAEIDWLEEVRGPQAAVTPWHDQFLAMVTPEMARSYGAFTGTELLQVTATSIAQALAAKAIMGYARDALRRRQEAEARREVDAAIEQWQRERQELLGGASPN